MNGLALRVNPSNKKIKNSIGFPPIVLPTDENLEINHELFEKFSKSMSADEQLAVVKTAITSIRQDCEQDESDPANCDPAVMRFLALVFLHAEPKHPVKCFVVRYISRNERVQEPFAEELAKEVNRLLSMTFVQYSQYKDVVSKIITCTENFPGGTQAIPKVEMKLAQHLLNCLDCCTKTLHEIKLAPTEKNELFGVCHVALRIFHYIVQNVLEGNVSALIDMFARLKKLIKQLIFNEDTPMDTKSICGIVFLSTYLLDGGMDAFLLVLDSRKSDDQIKSLLANEAAELALYSAVATMPDGRILDYQIDGRPAVVCLTERIMTIGERSSSDSVFVLGVTRSMLQISKLLSSAGASSGPALMEHLLTFIWGHLEHYMDSVRHLSAQALANVVRYCTNLQNNGDETGLNRLFSALASLDQSCKSYYVSLTSLAAQLGARRVLARRPDVIRDVTRALNVQAVQASATTALEILLQKHVHETDSKTVYEAWVVPTLAYVAEHELDSSVLSILENLMARAVTLDENVFDLMLPYIQESCYSEKNMNLKCVLMVLSVARKSGVAGRAREDHAPGLWKGIIGYDVLHRAAVDAVEEIRILSLSLVIESPKSTEAFSEGDLEFILHYLRYNINAQSPNFRQLTLSYMKKFTNRLCSSYLALRRSGRPAAQYAAFAPRLRARLSAGLLRGANPGRRRAALQLLAWAGGLPLDQDQRIWKEEYVEKLLLHLEDSYENNKKLALQILEGAPSSLFQGKKYRVSLDVDTILREASSMKPTDCVSAAYKLNFLRKKLPEQILEGNVCSTSEPVLFALLNRLLVELQRQLGVCQRSIVVGARRGPMYGLLHCIGHLMEELDADAISDDEAWRALASDIISTCIQVNAAVACVVNNSSPEGHLPMDAGGVAVGDYGNSGDVVLEDGRPVTAQMVLLCAWRSVKEVSLLLGTMASKLTIAGEGSEHGTLSHQQMELIGEHFTKLLAETKHRGAFEQAYVGFTRLLARLWRCRGPLHALPGAWLRALTAGVAARRRTATRRSAGLPFMIQALVTTELQVQGNPKCLHECITTLLRLARSPKDHPEQTTNTSDSNIKDLTEHSSVESTEGLSKVISDGTGECDSIESGAVESRTHSVNILRALFRNSMLEESLAGYVGEGLMVALQGFEGDTWMERNSSTLLFSALMVRVFGVARDRHSETPAVRNTMTGRIFFLRYPQLYDFILNKLKQASSSMDTLHPSLYPVLVLLGRLYPSSLEGCASALRLAALVPPALDAAKSRVLATRRLAARAVVPLISPEQYMPHLASMFTILASRSIERNHCHGILLQVTRLLDSRPQDLVPNKEVSEAVQATTWILEQASGDRPCYVVADEYVRMVNLAIWRLPSVINTEMLKTIKEHLDKIIFNDNIPNITSGREICLANCIYLYFVISNKLGEDSNLPDLIYKGLEHKCYEVVLSTLNYLLILNKKLDIDDSNRFQQHLSTFTNENVLSKLRDSSEYIDKVCKILKSNKYLECLQKALRLLTLEKDTQKYIVSVKLGKETLSDEEIIRHLFTCIQNEHENLTHIYLESLSDFVSEKLKSSSISKGTVLDVIRAIFACSSSENSDSTRHVVAEFVERNFEILLKFDLDGLNEEEKFEFTSTLWATMVTIIEDDNAVIRQRAADVVLVTSAAAGGVLPARAAELLRAQLARGEHAEAMLVLLALLDFKSEVCMTDEISDECRVFDQNERYNIFLEECMWTEACADELLKICESRDQKADQFALSIVNNTVYRKTFDKLCNTNVILFKEMINNKTLIRNDVLNPKIEQFISKLRC